MKAGPDWASEPTIKPSKTAFLGKTIRRVHQMLAEDFHFAEYSARPGLLQAIDPRIKLAGVILLISAAGLCRSLYILVFLLFLVLVLLKASRLPVWTLSKRIWGFLPLITLVAALPGTLSIFNPGGPLLILYHNSAGVELLGFNLAGPIYISKPGLTAAFFLFLRVGLSVSLGALLVLTTPVARLFRSLHLLRVPTLFVMIVEMSYRYLILLLNTSLEMFEARGLRTVGRLSGPAQRGLLGSSLAALFGRSVALSEEVFQAMTARGYTGEPVSLEPFKLRILDIASLVIIAAFSIGVAFGGIIIG